MTLEMNDLDHVLKLAHLEIPEPEKPRYLSHLTHILHHMENLNQWDLSNIDPTLYAHTKPTQFREDAPITQPDLLQQQNAPQWENNCYRVPKILGDEA